MEHNYNSIGSADIQVKTKFVQERGKKFCANGGLFNLISEKHGFSCRCRDARCSFECKQRWAIKEATIDARFLIDKLPVILPRALVYRGCLTMPKDANLQAHKVARAKFDREINSWRKKLGRKIGFKGNVHITDKHNLHYDYLLYADDVRPKKMRWLLLRSATKAGFLRATCRPVNTSQQIKGTAKYNVKRDAKPKQGQPYIFLAERGTGRLTWQSRNFYLGDTKKSLWEELRKILFSAGSPPIKLSNISTTPYEEVRRQLPFVLPTRPEEAIDIPFLAQHIRWPEVESRTEILNRLFREFPGVRTMPGERYWLESNRDTPLAVKIFGNKPITYHENFWPLPLDVEDVCKPVEPLQADDENEIDEDFEKELERVTSWELERVIS